MSNKAKKQINAIKLNALVQIIAILCALTTYLICQLAVGQYRLGFAPIWTLFIGYFSAVFICQIPVTVITKSILSYLYCCFSGIIGIEILCFCVVLRYWLLWLICGVGLTVLTLVVMTFLKADKFLIQFDMAPSDRKKGQTED